jgi:hypothetical protein
MAGAAAQAQRHGLAAVEGIRNEVEGLLEAEAVEEIAALAGQGSVVAVGELHPLVDVPGERDGKVRVGGADQDRDHLDGMPHDVGGLGVALSRLVKELHRRHLPAGFSHLDAIAEQHGPAGKALYRQHLQHLLRPAAREALDLHRRGVEEVEEAIVAARRQPQGAHDARDAEQVRAG